MNEKAKRYSEHTINSIIENIKWDLICICIGIVLFMIVHSVVGVCRVSGSSMENTFQSNDRCLMYKLAYCNKEPERGDVITFDSTIQPEEIFIKRVIGLPGEDIVIQDGRVFINGNELEEPYVKEVWTDGIYEEFHVPEGTVFVLGDNRLGSSDFRFWPGEAYDMGVAPTMEAAESYAFVPYDAIRAKCIIKIYPGFEKIN